MLAVAGGILLALLILVLLPAIFELIPILLGAGILLFVAVLIITGAIPLEIVILGFGLLFALGVFGSFKGNHSMSDKSSISYAAGRKLAASKSMVSQQKIPRSKKIEFQRKIRLLTPALTNRSALKKIKDLKEIDDQQVEYEKLAMQTASAALDTFTVYLVDHLSKQFQVYIESDLLRLVTNRHEDMPETATFKCDISIQLGDEASEIASVCTLVRAISEKRSIRTISLFLSKSDLRNLHGISIKKAVRNINKLIISELKKNPQLIDKIKKTET
ncbi:hypothetical protein [Lentibacter algarum]|uniref:hypothetical protein n=1 Tax=Lentibacter algarum TaxID=576131 RepID=UPI00339D9D8F